MTDSKNAGADSVSRQLTGADAPDDTNREGQTGPTGGMPGEMSPEGVGESVGHRAEDMIAEDGKEAGRIDTGTQGKTNRPTGTSTARDSSGVDPQEPVTDGEFHDAVVPAAK